VRLSVFECRLDDVLFETRLKRIAGEIDGQHDSLRVYHLPAGRVQPVRVLSRDK
jgi:CRISPR/Cas system-associated endoribonuclease Cas2